MVEQTIAVLNQPGDSELSSCRTAIAGESSLLEFARWILDESLPACSITG